MRFRGSASWRLSLHNPQSLDIALFVRDAVGIVAPPSPEVPPALAAQVADHTAVLTDAARTEAGEQWLGWWRRLIAHETSPRPNGDTEEDMVTQGRRRIAEYQRVMDPPGFESLADFPALQRAAIGTFGAASTRRPADGHLHFDQALVSGVAQEIIAEYGVSPDRVDAAVIAIDVAGAWSYLARSGTMCCAVGVISDPVAARALLREAFVSGLAA